jgi:hypothetical protein
MSNLLGKELRVKCYAVEKICRKGREVLNLLGKEPRVRCHVVEKIWRRLRRELSNGSTHCELT